MHIPQTLALSRVTLMKKLGLATGIVAVAVFILLALVYHSETEAIGRARREIAGVQLHRQVRGFSRELSVHRGAAVELIGGDAGKRAVVDKSRETLDGMITSIESARAAAGLDVAAPWKKMRDGWTEARETGGVSVQETVKRHTDLSTSTVSMMDAIAEASQIVLDPSLDAYYLLDAIIWHEPRATTLLGQLRVLGAILFDRSLKSAERERLGKLLHSSEERHQLLKSGLDRAGRVNAGVKAKLDPIRAEVDAKLDRALEAVRQLVVTEAPSFTKPEYVEMTSVATGATFDMYVAVSKEAEAMIAARLANLERHRAIVLAGVLAALALGWAIGLAVLVDLHRRMRHATEVAGAVATGDLDRPIRIEGDDEVTALTRAFADVAERIRALHAAQTALAAAQERGDTDHRIDAGALPGAFGHLAKSLNGIVDASESLLVRFRGVVQSYAQGDFDADMPELPGRRRELTEAAREVKANLVAVSDEIDRLGAAAARGDFTQRGDASQYRAAFRAMIEALNRLMQVCDRGLGDASRMFAALARGDLTERMGGDYEGRFAHLRDDANRTVAQLAERIVQVRDAANAIDTGAGEIAQGNHDLSARNEAQASSLEQTASAMDELTTTVKGAATNAQQANALASEASSIAEEGGRKVGAVVETMNGIADASRRIADIISVIDGIAFQTNILALNAAVEAARAGEQGRGFAVVASEVRNLAQRSAGAAKEISGLIGASVERVNEGTRLVNEAGEQMDRTVRSVKRVSDIIGEIASTAGEQATGIEQVNQAVILMDQTTQQNAALVEESAAAAQSMKDQSAALVTAMAVFKVEADARAGQGERPATRTQARPRRAA